MGRLEKKYHLESLQKNSIHKKYPPSTANVSFFCTFCFLENSVNLYLEILLKIMLLKNCPWKSCLKLCNLKTALGHAAGFLEIFEFDNKKTFSENAFLATKSCYCIKTR